MIGSLLKFGIRAGILGFVVKAIMNRKRPAGDVPAAPVTPRQF